METTIDKSTSVSFTGYRTNKILQSIKRPNLINEIYSELYTTVKTLYEQGYTIYNTGMAQGLDMIAAEVVLTLKKEGYDIKLIAVIPFMGQELGYANRDRIRYKAIFESADKVVLTSESYDKDCYFKRNDYLLANCSQVVCYYSGRRGGTMYTVNRAIKAGLPIINIFDTLTTKGLIETTPLQNDVSCWESIKSACAKMLLP